MGVELKALHRAEKTGELAAFKPGRAVVYRHVDVVALVERARVAAPEGTPGPANDAEPDDPFERALARADRRSSRVR